MVYGKVHAGDDIQWRKVSFSFVTPEGAAMMDIAINTNAVDEHLKIDDISLVEYDTENLLEKYNYDFDTVYGASNPELGTGAVITDTDAHSGSKSLSLPSGYFKFYTVPLQPSTNYTLSFWMKNSKADAVILYGGNSYFYTAAVAGIGGFFSGELTIGEDPKGEIKWRKAQLNFTTPANAGLMNIYINGNGDEALLVDDICLAQSGKDFGIIANGDFEGAIIPGTLIGWLGSSYTIQTEAETGNKYITSSTDFVEYPSGILGAVPGKRIKVSFKAKGAKPYFRFYNESVIWEYQNDANAGPLVGINAGEDTWETYSMYINATKVKNAGDTFIKSPLVIYASMIDDVYIGEDKNEFGFYEALDFRYKEGDPRHYTPSYAAADGNWANSFTSEKSVPIDALSDITPDADGAKSVSARAHVIPTEILAEDGTGTGTYNKTEVTLFTGVYKYENGKKSLVDFDVKTEASEDGKVLDPVTTVKVPADTDGVTYKVEAMTWNMAQGMQPVLFDKAVLQ